MYEFQFRAIYLPYSDVEKTVINMVYFKQKLNEETIRELIKKIDRKKLNSYLKIYPKNIRKTVIELVTNN